MNTKESFFLFTNCSGKTSKPSFFVFCCAQNHEKIESKTVFAIQNRKSIIKALEYRFTTDEVSNLLLPIVICAMIKVTRDDTNLINCYRLSFWFEKQANSKHSYIDSNARKRLFRLEQPANSEK